MNCIYRVNEYYGNNYTGISYMERDGVPVLQEVAHIRYKVDGDLLEYEVMTDQGEQIAFSKWIDSSFKSKELAEIHVIESALKAVYRCANVPCLVDGESSDEVLRRLYKICEISEENEETNVRL